MNERPPHVYRHFVMPALLDDCGPTTHLYFFDSLNADFVSSYKKLDV
jgi:hypothetical protein